MAVEVTCPICNTSLEIGPKFGLPSENQRILCKCGACLTVKYSNFRYWLESESE